VIREAVSVADRDGNSPSFQFHLLWEFMEFQLDSNAVTLSLKRGINTRMRMRTFLWLQIHKSEARHVRRTEPNEDAKREEK
jgi:hypothetical protein